MEIREIRIGNRIEYLTVQNPDRWEEIVVSPVTFGRLSMEPLRFRPIELTPEWLTRLGFKQGDNVTSNDSFYVIKLGVSELGINPDNGVCWITNLTGSINNPLCLDFVHQVQNLFYSMTGEELAIDKTSLKK